MCCKWVSVYVTTSPGTDIRLTIAATTSSRWNVKVTQIECPGLGLSNFWTKHQEMYKISSLLGKYNKVTDLGNVLFVVHQR